MVVNFFDRFDCVLFSLEIRVGVLILGLYGCVGVIGFVFDGDG